MASSANQYSNENMKKKAKSASREVEPGLDQKYTQEEIDAANALLSLKHSAAAPPPGCTFTVIAPQANPVPPSHSAEDIKTPFPSQNPTYQSTSFHYQAPALNHMSPLAELDNFVAARFPGRAMEGMYQPSYQDFAAARPVPWMQCGAHGVWTCRQCFSPAAMNH